MATLSLDPELEQTVNDAARSLGLTKSELVRKSIIEYIGKFVKPTPWELGQDLFGRHSSGAGNLSSDRKALLVKKIRAARK